MTTNTRLLLLTSALLLPAPWSQAAPPTLGLKVAGGGRYDNVRMCVASPAGTKGGPAMDLSLVTEWNIHPSLSLALDLPLLRPLLFGTAFQMLQLEPSVDLRYILHRWHSARAIVGGGLGLILHYGPDYRSDLDKRGKEFFALGPKVSAYLGVAFPIRSLSLELGLHPYLAPLISLASPHHYDGFVAGGMVDLLLAFR